jgi:hypothetical protein
MNSRNSEAFSLLARNSDLLNQRKSEHSKYINLELNSNQDLEESSNNLIPHHRNS